MDTLMKTQQGRTYIVVRFLDITPRREKILRDMGLYEGGIIKIVLVSDSAVVFDKEGVELPLSKEEAEQILVEDYQL